MIRVHSGAGFPCRSLCISSSLTSFAVASALVGISSGPVAAPVGRYVSITVEIGLKLLRRLELQFEFNFSKGPQDEPRMLWRAKPIS